ncbi:DUF805 domain-containing protein [Paenibacillus sp. R14(2021)]|uniref:DUF805 domain-containing protein n=1 Tax=Paenibacillus sp. R14(2021) TaxID=2859228 RepID=UPI001C61408E|nr:DUF805 domain-containing protein [Paenibacillus sp. R14(2021)]
MDWYLKVLQNYAVFTGRARRKEFWMFILFNILMSIALTIVDHMLGTYRVLSMLYSLAVIVPSIAVMVRRLHDTGRSGWWYLLVLIPFVGGIILLVFACQDSDPGSNRYGPNPKL